MAQISFDIGTFMPEQVGFKCTLLPLTEKYTFEHCSMPFWNWIALRHIDFKSHLALRLSMLPTPQAAAGQQASQKKTGCKDQSGRCFQAQHRKRRFRIRHHTSDGISFIPRKAVSHSLQNPDSFEICNRKCSQKRAIRLRQRARLTWLL